MTDLSALERMPICDWTQKFSELYETPDSNRSPEEFWNAVMAHLSAVGEAIRRHHYHDLFSSAAHAFCWMCCYINKCNQTDDLVFKINHSLSEIVALKFPDKCGHCRKNPCSCNPVIMDASEDKSAFYQELLTAWERMSGCSHYSVFHFFDMFHEIYAHNIHLQTLESIGFHLLEEAGEEAKAVRQLIQFRGLHINLPDITADYLESLADIPTLVNEYSKHVGIIKEKYGAGSEKEAKKKICTTDPDIDIIKSRLVLAKMDFIIEVADTFSWFFAVLIKVNNIYNSSCTENIPSLIKSLAEIYETSKPDDKLTCYACNQPRCECLMYPRVCS